MGEPKFEHDCDKCVFLGHFLNHDVYVCPSKFPKGPSIIARFGNESHENASTPVCLLKRLIVDNSIISGESLPNGMMRHQNYYTSEYANDWARAWIIALAVHGIDNVMDIDYAKNVTDKNVSDT